MTGTPTRLAVPRNKAQALLAALAPTSEVGAYRLSPFSATGKLFVLIALKGILHQASARVRVVREGSQCDGRRSSLGLMMEPPAPSESETAAGPFSGSSVPRMEIITQESSPTSSEDGRPLPIAAE